MPKTLDSRQKHEYFISQSKVKRCQNRSMLRQLGRLRNRICVFLKTAFKSETRTPDQGRGLTQFVSYLQQFMSELSLPICWPAFSRLLLLPGIGDNGLICPVRTNSRKGQSILEFRPWQSTDNVMCSLLFGLHQVGSAQKARNFFTLNLALQEIYVQLNIGNLWTIRLGRFYETWWKTDGKQSNKRLS